MLIYLLLKSPTFIQANKRRDFFSPVNDDDDDASLSNSKIQKYPKILYGPVVLLCCK